GRGFNPDRGLSPLKSLWFAVASGRSALVVWGMRGQRPRERAAEQRDELAPSQWHSISHQPSRMAGYRIGKDQSAGMRTSDRHPEGPCRFRGTGVTEHWIGLPHQSALMLRARMTLPHFSVSSVMSLLKSPGEPPRIM